MNAIVINFAGFALLILLAGCGVSFVHPISDTNSTSPTSTPSPAPTECDGAGSPEDGLCPGEFRIFVTSSGYDGDLETNGMGTDGQDGANNLCATHATSGGLSKTYVALVSGASFNAADLSASGEIYVFSNADTRVQVATSSTDLWDSSIGAAVQYDESYTQTSADVWTGSTAAGQGSAQVGDHCNSFTTNAGITTSFIGDSSQTDSDWVSQAMAVACNMSNRLYCLSQ